MAPWKSAQGLYVPIPRPRQFMPHSNEKAQVMIAHSNICEDSWGKKLNDDQNRNELFFLKNANSGKQYSKKDDLNRWSQ